jgi:hypothetical protein
MSDMEVEAAQPLEMLVSYHVTTHCHDPEDHYMNDTKVEAAQLLEVSVSYHITAQCHDTEDHNFIAMKISNLISCIQNNSYIVSYYNCDYKHTAYLHHST